MKKHGHRSNWQRIGACDVVRYQCRQKQHRTGDHSNWPARTRASAAITLSACAWGRTPSQFPLPPL